MKRILCEKICFSLGIVKIFALICNDISQRVVSWKYNKTCRQLDKTCANCNQCSE